MIGFIVAIIAGFLTPQIQAAVAQPLAKALGFLTIEEAEMPVLGFMVAMLAAALIAVIFGSGSALGIAVGLCLGYFGTRLAQIVQDAISGKKDAE